MKFSGKRERKTIVWEIVFLCALLAFITFSFFIFTRDNSRRVLEQNDSFIESATMQSAARMNDLLDLAGNNVEILAHLYGSIMTEPVVDADMLQDMTERSFFDYVEFISTDGTDLTADGRTADLSDREYYLEGMQGRSGRCVVYHSRITSETLLIFYTPFYYNGEIIGVLSGILREETIPEHFADVDYFGMRGSSYLIEADGSIVSYSGNGEKPENLLRQLQETSKLDSDDFDKLENALATGTSAKFNYIGENGVGSAYVTPLKGGDLFLVQSFPTRLNKGMTQSANSAGIRLEIKLFIAFLLYIAYIVVKNWLQRRKLLSEKQEISKVADAVPHLFTRFALVDLVNDTYEYLEGKKGDAPERGRYSDLLEHLRPKYIAEDDSGRTMTAVLTAEAIRKRLTQGTPFLQYEYQIDMGGRRWENMSIMCLTREEGKAVQVLFAIQDVTAIKEREIEIRMALKSASEAAEAANRAKSDFLARMSHDIRTPMNAIMGMTAVAQMHMDDQERLTDCLNKITISSRHLLALINDVLDMSKIESGKVTLSEEPFTMSDMVESVVTIIRAQVNGKRQQLRVHISDIRHEDVIGDTLRLRQIFVNILGNAVKFTPEGGIITFNIRECDSRIYGMGCYEFVCEDTGVGMDEAFLKTIFDPFTRAQDPANSKIEGTGLGMSITRNIVRMMDGDIQVESTPGKGSVFTVQVHLKLQDAHADDVKDLADLRVLVADDDLSACTSTCDILESMDMKAEWVLSGDEAIEKTVSAHESGEDYAAVILDWKMPPGKNGIDTAREIRSRIGDELPIIILSAYDWTEVEAQAREAGIRAFIEKPLFRSRLVYALRSVLVQEDREQEAGISRLEGHSHEGRRVLLAEDNELNREIATELLSYIGVIVEQAADGGEAVGMVADHEPHYYDLIFMDIQMPVMNGYEAARQIRALQRDDTADIPIVAMTANAFADDIREAHEAGMNDHIAKPVEVEKLQEALDKWLV